ncbi:hypothetical protein C0J52_27059, partial [Blattella germanica]
HFSISFPRPLTPNVVQVGGLHVKPPKKLPLVTHPNVKLFITHGGLLSTQETIDRGVPVIGIPIYGDQYMNMANTVSLGIGVKLELSNISMDSVLWAINEILDNPSIFASHLSLLIWICLVSCLHLGEGARILGIFPIPSKSHWAVNQALIQELAKRGHKLTVLTPFPEKSQPNYKEIVIQANREDVLNNTVSLMVWNMGNLVTDQMLQLGAVQDLIHSDQEFDLIISEGFFTDGFLGFVHKFKAPLIQTISFGGFHWMHDWVGNTSPYAYIPNTFLGFSDKMNFWERLQNTFTLTFEKVTRRIMFVPEQQKIMEKHFGKFGPLPSIDDIHASTSLMFLNNHFSTSYPRPLLPNIIEVGGMHIKPPKKLPEDLQKYLDDAPDGVVYFSLGSHFYSSDMPDWKVNSFLKAFSKLKQKVLWKWEKDTLPGQPKNVKLGKWLPQSDILAHPNVKLFMTHGGLLSTQETIYRGVPILGIPLTADQKMNTYVIRHKGAPHMRSAALDLTWYQYFLLDVFAALVLAVGIVLSITFLLVRAVYRKCCRRSKIKNRRGHELTVITPFPEKSPPPNYRDIVVQASRDDFLNETGHTNSLTMVDFNLIQMVLMMWGIGNSVSDQLLQQEAIQELINSDQQFDLILIEGFFNDAFLGFVHKFKVPFIQIITFGGLHWMHDWVGNTSPYAYVPEAFLGFSDKMNFCERLQNTLMITFEKVTRRIMFIPEQQRLIEKYFGQFGPPPSVDDIHASTSLVFLNNHFSTSYPRPLLPNIVEVGGMHIKPPKKLPEDLQKYLDDAPDGVIYFSLGSNFYSSDMPDWKINAFLEVFSKLEQKVLWKWEKDTLPGQPKNVKLGKWLPQSDILGGYRENAKRTSKIYQDQPLTPLETAVFWTEYVIRHKGAPHMHSAALDLSWYQYFLLDVIAVLFLAVGIVASIMFILIRAVYRKCCGKSKIKKRVSSKKTN